MLAKALLTLSIASSLLPTAGRAQGRSAPPDVILVGGKVFTADTSHLWAEAVAIRGERIVAVGTTAEISALAGPRTHAVQLDGRVVIPGINDAHDHAPPSSFMTE